MAKLKIARMKHENKSDEQWQAGIDSLWPIAKNR